MVVSATVCSSLQEAVQIPGVDLLPLEERVGQLDHMSRVGSPVVQTGHGRLFGARARRLYFAPKQGPGGPGDGGSHPR
jgi:hypothetical protein